MVLSKAKVQMISNKQLSSEIYVKTDVDPCLLNLS